MRWSDVRLCVGLTLFLLGLTVGIPLFAQALETASPGVTTPIASSGYTPVAFAFLVSSLFEWLKRKPWFGLVSEQTTWGVQRVLGIVIAVATAAGIHFGFDAATGTLTVTGLEVHMIGDAVVQYVLQELVYRNGVKNYRAGVLTT